MSIYSLAFGTFLSVIGNLNEAMEYYQNSSVYFSQSNNMEYYEQTLFVLGKNFRALHNF